MKRQVLIIYGFLLVVVSAATVYACKAYWADIPARPVFIVVGTLSEVNKSTFVLPGGDYGNGSELRYVHDSGWIDVERVLHGDPGAMRLPVSWLSDTWLYPTPPDGIDVYTSTEESHSVGERRIWVLWRRDRYSDEFSMYFGFQDLPVENLKQVEKEIRDMRKK